MKSLETISRKDLIECIVSNAVPFNSKYFERMGTRLNTRDNNFLCDYMYKLTGVLLCPKSSQLLEFLN